MGSGIEKANLTQNNAELQNLILIVPYIERHIELFGINPTSKDLYVEFLLKNRFEDTTKFKRKPVFSYNF